MSIAKKTVIGAAGALVVGALVFGSSLFSYMRTAGTNAREAVEEAVPLQFQLDRAQDLLENELKPQVRKMKSVVANADVEVEELTVQIDETANLLASGRTGLRDRVVQLKSDPDKPTFVVNEVSYTRDRMTRDLETRMGEVKSLENRLRSEEEVLNAKKRALEANKEKIVELLAAEHQLGLRIQELEARLSAVEAKETVYESDFDDSALTHVKDLLDKVDHKINVREKEVILEGDDSHLIPTESEKPSSIIDEVSAYLGDSNGTETVVETEE